MDMECFNSGLQVRCMWENGEMERGVDTVCQTATVCKQIATMNKYGLVPRSQMLVLER